MISFYYGYKGELVGQTDTFAAYKREIEIHTNTVKNIDALLARHDLRGHTCRIDEAYRLMTSAVSRASDICVSSYTGENPESGSAQKT